jgi:hypothetical protein
MQTLYNSLMTAEFFVSEKKIKVIIITQFNQATRIDWQNVHTTS